MVTGDGSNMCHEEKIVCRFSFQPRERSNQKEFCVQNVSDPQKHVLVCAKSIVVPAFTC